MFRTPQEVKSGERRVSGPISAIGVDEIAYNRGHGYLTLVYPIEAGMVRLSRAVKSFRRFFDMLGREMNKALDEVRVGEARKLAIRGMPTYLEAIAGTV